MVAFGVHHSKYLYEVWMGKPLVFCNCIAVLLESALFVVPAEVHHAINMGKDLPKRIAFRCTHFQMTDIKAYRRALGSGWLLHLCVVIR